MKSRIIGTTVEKPRFFLKVRTKVETIFEKFALLSDEDKEKVNQQIELLIAGQSSDR